MTNHVIFYRLSLRNFLSYGNNLSSIDLLASEPTAIIGRNLDVMSDGNIDSNGAGKSSIIKGITYVLFGKTIDKMDSVDSLINKFNKKNMQVSLCFSVGNCFYKIERFRKNKLKGGDGVELLEYSDSTFSDFKNITPDSIQNTNKKISELLGMDFDSFCRIVVYSAGNTSFLSLPTTSVSEPNQRDILELVLGLSILGKKADVLKEEIKNTKRDISIKEAIVAELIKVKKQNDETLNNNKIKYNEWGLNKANKINNLKELYKNYSTIDFEKQIAFFEEKNNIDTELAKVSNDIDNLSKTIKTNEKNKLFKLEWDASHSERISITEKNINLLTHDYDSIISNFEQLSEYENILNKINQSLNKLENSSAKLKKDREDFLSQHNSLKESKCPFCHQEYHDVDKLKEIQKNIEHIIDEENKISILNNDLIEERDNILKKISEIKKDNQFKSISEARVAQNKYENLLNNLNNIKDEKNPYNNSEIISEKTILKYQKTLSDLEDEKNQLLDKLNYIKNNILFSSIKEVSDNKSKFEKLTAELSILENEKNPFEEIVNHYSNIIYDESEEAELSELNNYLKHQNFLFNLLTKKDSFIRKRLLNKKLPLLNKKLSEYLTFIGLPHSVKILEDMTIQINYLGAEFNYLDLSAGQKARINIALLFAFRYMLQLNAIKINFCLLDEALDIGLGNVGIQSAARLVKKIAADEKLAMFVISHKEEITSMFNSKIEIELKNGFSNIVNSSLKYSSEEISE